MEKNVFLYIKQNKQGCTVNKSETIYYDDGSISSIYNLENDDFVTESKEEVLRFVKDFLEESLL
jgi:hypothetical protein